MNTQIFHFPKVNNVQKKPLRCFCWDHYYNEALSIEENYENKKYTSENTTLTPKIGNSYVYNCFFYNLTADYGAAILFSLTGSNLLIEKCLIYNCTATQNTAGIRVTKGNCIISFVCGQKG